MMDGAGIAKEPVKQDGEVRWVGGGPAWLCTLGKWLTLFGPWFLCTTGG